MNSYTEDEAKGKWCPFARAVVAVSETTQGLPPQYKAMASGNRFLNGTISPCIGSGCMAWRWGQKRNPDWKPPAMYGMGGFPSHPADEAPAYVTDHERGYCGLAGRPS